MPDNRKRLNEADMQLVKDLSVFNESGPEQYMMKVLFSCGCIFGFCGSKEHTSMEVNKIEHNTFPTGYPWARFEYYGITGMFDKTHQISVNNPHPRNTKQIMRIPIVSDDP